MTTPMDETERQQLADEFAKKDRPTLTEVVRLGESFLQSQLQSALAADMRAMALAAVLAAIGAGVIGGLATVIAAKMDIGWHALAPTIFGIATLIALHFAIQAAKPTSFTFAGNNPLHWKDDGGDEASLNQAMAEQASLYAKGISENKSVLYNNHRCIRRALNLILLGLILASMAEIVVVFAQVGQEGAS